MWWPTYPSRSESLARAFHDLVLIGGIEAVTVRALAREMRTAPGTITNHYPTRSHVLTVCAGVIGRVLLAASSDRLRDGGIAGLLPSSAGAPDQATSDPATGDIPYAQLLSVWVQLRAHALVCPEVAREVAAADDRLVGLVRIHLGGTLSLEHVSGAAGDDDLAWAALQGLVAQHLVTASRHPAGDIPL